MRAEIGEVRVRANGTFKKVGQGLWQRVQDEKAQGAPGAPGAAQAKPASDKQALRAERLKAAGMRTPEEHRAHIQSIKDKTAAVKSATASYKSGTKELNKLSSDMKRDRLAGAQNPAAKPAPAPAPVKKPEPMAAKPKVDSIGSSLPKRSSPLLSESRDTRAAIERGAKPAANDYVSKLPGQKAQADADKGRREAMAVHQGAGGPKTFSKPEKAAADAYLDKLPGQQAKAKKEADDYVSNLPGQRAQASAGKARRESMAAHQGAGGPKSFTPAEKSAAGSYLDRLSGQSKPKAGKDPVSRFAAQLKAAGPDVRPVSTIPTGQRTKMQRMLSVITGGAQEPAPTDGNAPQSGGHPAGRYKAWAKK